MGSLDGKVALVTGAARAQGRAHAITLAKEGADVVLCDIGHDLDDLKYSLGTQDELDQTVKEVEALDRRAVAQLADVRSQASLDALVAAGLAEFGRIDIAIANAAIFDSGPIWELTEERWQAVIDINLNGVWRTAKAVIPAMIDQGGGTIVMIASTNALEVNDGHGGYATSKHGVIGLMKSVALEGAPLGIRCNAICPGFVKSGMTTFQEQLDKYAGHPGGTDADLEHAGLSYHPTRDLSCLDPQRIADVAKFLVSDESAAITGVAVPVDAGHLLLPGYTSR